MGGKGEEKTGRGAKESCKKEGRRREESKTGGRAGRRSKTEAVPVPEVVSAFSIPNRAGGGRLNSGHSAPSDPSPCNCKGSSWQQQRPTERDGRCPAWRS